MSLQYILGRGREKKNCNCFLHANDFVFISSSAFWFTFKSLKTDAVESLISFSFQCTKWFSLYCIYFSTIWIVFSFFILNNFICFSVAFFACIFQYLFRFIFYFKNFAMHSTVSTVERHWQCQSENENISAYLNCEMFSFRAWK